MKLIFPNSIKLSLDYHFGPFIFITLSPSGSWPHKAQGRSSSWSSTSPFDLILLYVSCLFILSVLCVDWQHNPQTIHGVKNGVDNVNHVKKTIQAVHMRTSDTIEGILLFFIEKLTKPNQKNKCFPEGEEGN